MSKYLDPILTVLSTGPKTNEDIRRALARAEVFASLDTIRKVCAIAEGKGLMKKRSVVTKQCRTGIAIWSMPGESEDQIASVALELAKAPSSALRVVSPR